jgi:hypothetical protein
MKLASINSIHRGCGAFYNSKRLDFIVLIEQDNVTITAPIWEVLSSNLKKLPANLTDDFRDFPKSIHASVGLISRITSQPASFKSLPTHHP